MIDLLKRHEIQVLRRAGHSLPDVAKLAGVGVRSVQRVEAEAGISHVDNDAERVRRRIGRPSKAEPYRALVVAELTKEPHLLAGIRTRSCAEPGFWVTGAARALFTS